ncbi:MAG: hypothetical protein NTZ59_05020 [Bacteroidetes bacterium]|jgi:hypothetical protein|nr:hypothetical protein [Bacteroidota bacterium]
MKSKLLFSIVIFAVCSAFTITNNPSQDLIGTWKIDEGSINGVTRSIISFTQKTNPDLADQLEGQEEGMKQMVRSLIINYKADNTYEIQTPQGPQTGKWHLENNNTYLVATRDGKPDRKDSVLEISSTRLKLINRERGDTTLYIRP